MIQALPAGAPVPAVVQDQLDDLRRLLKKQHDLLTQKNAQIKAFQAAAHRRADALLLVDPHGTGYALRVLSNKVVSDKGSWIGQIVVAVESPILDTHYFWHAAEVFLRAGFGGKVSGTPGRIALTGYTLRDAAPGDRLPLAQFVVTLSYRADRAVIDGQVQKRADGAYLVKAVTL